MSISMFQDLLDVISTHGDAIADGFIVTLKLLVGSCVAGFMLAVPLSVARTSENNYIRLAALAYSSIFRGTPLLVQIFIFYYGLGQFEAVRESFLWAALGDSFYCGLIVLTLNLAAYTAENIRAGILAVAHGEVEAAIAYGLSRFQRYRCIILPQALRVATPVLGNDVIAQMKATALVSTITVIDLTGVVRRLSARSYTTDALLVAALIYALTALLISLMVHWLERRHSASAAR